MTGKRKNASSSKKYFKRPKYSDGVSSKLEIGMKGVLVSHDRSKERFCQQDTFRILNHFADQLYGVEVFKESKGGDSDCDDDNIEDALNNEVKAIKKTCSAKGQKLRRFSAVKSGCNNLIFIRFSDGVSPGDLIAHVAEAISSSNDLKSSNVPYVRNVLRVHPVEYSCPAYLDSMQKTIPKYLTEKFARIEGVQSKEYNIMFKSRNNTHLDKEVIKQDLFSDIRSAIPDWKFNCRTDSVIVMIDVLKTICLVSVVKDYLKFKKYNIRELLQKPAAQDTVQVSAAEINHNQFTNPNPDSTDFNQMDDEVEKKDSLPQTYCKTDSKQLSETVQPIADSAGLNQVNDIVEENGAKNCGCLTETENSDGGSKGLECVSTSSSMKNANDSVTCDEHSAEGSSTWVTVSQTNCPPEKTESLEELN